MHVEGVVRGQRVRLADHVVRPVDGPAREPCPRGVTRTINRVAAAAPLVPELAADGTTAGWAPPVRARQVLSTLAREMIDLLTDAYADDVCLMPPSPSACPMVPPCVSCSRPSMSAEVESSHYTSEGVVRYLRCACGQRWVSCGRSSALGVGLLL
ncbi:ABATE domain-containing protein [Nonomuraea sp. B19D2]|uniref:ABATE domain-containing protein n=1 Tax=Nonomuraea sp. B19D2 TaxID=3159561 RepID=UPI0032DA6143